MRKMTLNKKGVSLFETLIVIVLFAALGILSTRIIMLSLRGTSKSTAVLRVRENLNYALSVIERNVRNADSLVDCDGSRVVNYVDSNEVSTSFSCEGNSSNGYVASGSGLLKSRLTNTDIIVTSCSISCSDSSSLETPWVEISLKGKDAAKTGIESASAEISTMIYLRQY
jgi:hypothetical protein